MNTILLTGNVGQAPELRSTGNGTPYVNVTLATNRVYKDREGQLQQATEWHRLTLWGDGAPNFARIVGRGDLLSVRGRLEYRQRIVDGKKLQDAVIRIAEWQKLSRKKGGEEAPTAASDAGAAQAMADVGQVGPAAEPEAADFDGETGGEVEALPDEDAAPSALDGEAMLDLDLPDEASQVTETPTTRKRRQ